VQVGTVWINSHGSIDAGVPFGGWKQSGVGVIGGKEGTVASVEDLELTLAGSTETLEDLELDTCREYRDT
jgi:acyl-CoA reductase-like NAD-dependent aldehyde dehydrogenase